MESLRSCPRCRRHHRVDDTSCPFCGRARRPSALVPVLAALGLTACPGPVRSVYAGPPPDRDPAHNDLLEQIEAENAADEGVDDEAGEAPLESAADGGAPVPERDDAVEREGA